MYTDVISYVAEFFVQRISLNNFLIEMLFIIFSYSLIIIMYTYVKDIFNAIGRT